MSRVTLPHPLAPGWAGALLLMVIGGTSCDSATPSNDSARGLVLVTATGGIQPDSDGYTIMVDGTAHGAIGANDRVTVADVDPGSHDVALSGIQFNCATLGQFTRAVSIAADAGAVVNYSVACDAVSRSRIAFVRDRNSGTLASEVSLMNADGSNVTSLKESLGAVYSWMTLPPVRWSADGNRVAFTRADGALYATTGGGTSVIQLAPVGTSPIWSEDGRKVAFLAAEPGSTACCWDIFVAESDGSGVAQVTDGLSLLDYSFAATGSLLAFVGDPATPASVSVVRPDGTGQREIAPPGVCCFQLPSLSPDGTKVAYSAYPDAQGDAGPGYEIYISLTDGSGSPTNVSDNPGDDWWPVWSPDGSKIAFVSSPPGVSFGRGSIHVVNADGTGQNTLTPGDIPVWEPAWSPDGSRIAYAGVVGLESHVFVANADGSGRTDVTPNMDSMLPTWTGR